MTSFAGNAGLSKRSIRVAIDATVDVRELTRMTQQAARIDRAIPSHSWIVLVSRRGIPPLLLRIPGNGRLEKIAVAKDEIAKARRSRADDKVEAIFFSIATLDHCNQAISGNAVLGIRSGMTETPWRNVVADRSCAARHRGHFVLPDDFRVTRSTGVVTGEGRSSEQ